jgi:hypothetical protein
MKTLTIAVWILAASLQAQQPKPVSVEVVPVDQEPSHKLVFENEYVRVFSVEVAPHSETKYHRHDRDSVGVMLGDSEVESVRIGEAPVTLQRKDGETSFTKGGFAHKAVNKSDKPFRNVTVELKQGPLEGIAGLGCFVKRDGLMACSGFSKPPAIHKPVRRLWFSVAPGGPVEGDLTAPETFGLIVIFTSARLSDANGAVSAVAPGHLIAIEKGAKVVYRSVGDAAVGYVLLGFPFPPANVSPR